MKHARSAQRDASVLRLALRLPVLIPVAAGTATELARRFEQLAFFFFFDGETFWLCPGVLDETAVTLPDRAEDTSDTR